MRDNDMSRVTPGSLQNRRGQHTGHIVTKRSSS